MKMAEYKNIQVEINNHVALVTIDHPPANAWNLGDYAGIQGGNRENCRENRLFGCWC
jgi:hypothetical protein